MTQRTAHRGASSRFLALLASLTMILAGLVGLGLASPANAGTSSWKDTEESCVALLGIWDDETSTCDSTEAEQECEDLEDGETWVWDDEHGTCAKGDHGNPNITCELLGLEDVTDQGDVWFDGKFGGWSSEIDITKVIVKGALDNKYFTPADPNGGEVDSVGLTTPNGENQPDISHIYLCSGDDSDPTVSVAVSGDFECVPAGEGPAVWRLIWTVKNTSTNTANLSLADDEGTGFANVPSGDSEDYWQYVATTGKYSLSWIATNEDGTSEPATGEVTVTGQCGNEPTYAAEITCSTWSASVQVPPVVIDYELFDEDQYKSVVKTGHVIVYIDDEQVAEGWLNENGYWTGGDVISPPFQDGATHTVTVTLDGKEVTSDTSGVCAVPTCQELQNCKTPPPVDQGTPPATAEVTSVVEAAVTTPPEAAAAAPAPANVAIPAKATLPAAVPAGDGSQAPGLPLWAVALAVVGLLGAGFSARSWAASRK